MENYEELKNKGAKDGDTIKILDQEFEKNHGAAIFE